MRGTATVRVWGKLGRRTTAIALALVAAAGCTTSTGGGPTARDAAPSTASNAVPTVTELPRIPWEGGPSYYKAFPQAVESGWTDPSFFPVGVWFESVVEPSDVEEDRAIGLNTYVELTANSDRDLVRRGGMTSISSFQPTAGAETVGWLLTDEPDMWAGPGSEQWTGSEPGKGEICSPAGAWCGYTVMSRLSAGFPNDGRLRYANYGKGVYFWQGDPDAARFVNEYTQVVSTDIYWYTDPNVCGEAERYRGLPPGQCRVAANYGAVIDRQRMLDAMDGRLQPIWGFVENGLPFNTGGRKITTQQMAGAVMSSLIHEARGIIYFNHNFQGDCMTQHVFREAKCDAGLRPATAELNRRIAELAPVLNTQSLAYTFNPDLDTMLKEKDGSYYVFAMPGHGAAPGAQALTLPAGLDASSAEVLFEGRTVPIGADRRMTDSFDEDYSYHIYKITP
jgi:hypothetical protein